jgi:hypothetical protein
MLTKIFNHPNNVGMTYSTHMKHSLTMSKLMFKSSIKAAIHAFLPDTYITSTSDTNMQLTEMLKPPTNKKIGK